MAKRRKDNSNESQPNETSTGPGLAARLAIGVAVSWHLFCVFVSPFSVRPSSELVEWIAQGPWVRWYTDPLYLNHGYHFFGPEPPVNQRMRWAVYDEAGATVATGEFPNTEEQWPRLLYHRHMMLADQASLAPAATEEEAVRLSLRSYARHLLRRHAGVEARIDCVRHALLLPAEVIADVDPNRADTFIPVDTVVVRAADLGTPLVTAPTEPLPTGGQPAEALR